MNIVLPWFLPFGITLALFGLRTALVERRVRGGRWRRDSIMIAALAWFPMLIWVLACTIGKLI